MGLPVLVEGPLQEVAERKGADCSPEGIATAIEAFPDRDHIEEAGKFASWHLFGDGRNAQISSVPAGFKRWLKRSAPASPQRRSKPTPVVALPSAESIEEGLAAVEKAWPEATRVLADAVPGSTFDLWIAPIEPAGATDGTVFLRAPEGICSWVERRYTGLIVEALAEAGFDGTPEVRFLPGVLPDEAAQAA